MAALYDVSPPSSRFRPAVLLAPVRVLGGARAALSALGGVVGCGMILAAMVVWVAPGGLEAAELVLMKLGVSLASATCGLMLLHSAQNARAPEVEIDVARQHLRFVRYRRGRRVVLHACAFDALGPAQISATTVTLYDRAGHMLAEVAPTDRAVLRALKKALRAAGKL